MAYLLPSHQNQVVSAAQQFLAPDANAADVRFPKGLPFTPVNSGR